MSPNSLISLDIEDDKLFLLHFVLGTYFGPDLKKPHPKKQSAFQIQATTSFPSHELSGSVIKRAELERVYHYILSNVDPSLIVKPRLLRQYFNATRCHSKADFPLFRDLYPPKQHPEIRVGNQYKLIKSIVFINDPDTCCMSQDCIDRFQRLTGLQSFTLSLNIDETEINSIVESLEPPKETPSLVHRNVAACTSGVNGAISGAQAGQVVGLMGIGECADAYLFRVSLPGVKRDERDFSCELEDNGKVLVRGVTTTGEKRVRRFSQVFEMQTQNLCPPGHFSVSFRLPGPVYPQEFSGSFGTDGILEGIVLKKLQKQFV